MQALIFQHLRDTEVYATGNGKIINAKNLENRIWQYN